MRTSLSYPFLHNERPPINFRASERDAPSVSTSHSLHIYELIWVREDRVGWGVPVCLPPHFVTRGADWSVKGDINLLSICRGSTIQLVSYTDCAL